MARRVQAKAWVPDMIDAVSPVLLAVTLAVSPCDAPGADPVYTRAARRAAAAWWPPQRKHLWCALVATAGVESGWKVQAVSKAGARGPWQIMPATWLDYVRRKGWKGSPFDPWLSAQVAAIHFEFLGTVWSAPRSAWCRLKLQAASYNAGQRHLIEAQRLSGGERCWRGIAPHLKKVTGRHAAETLAYVPKFERLLLRLWGVRQAPDFLMRPE